MEEIHSVRKRPKTPFKQTAQYAFILGMRDILALIIATTPFAIVYGALAISYGLSPWLVVSMSIFVFAGASQFIAITLLAASTAYPIILLTVFIVNLRHSLYAASLMPIMAKVPQLLRIPIGFCLTDEAYAVVKNRLLQAPDKPHFIAYYLGSALFMYSNWVLFSCLGMTLGQSVPNLTEWGLDIAMIVAFTGIVVPILKHRADWACAITATACTLVSYDWPHKTGLLFSAFVAIAVGFFLERYYKKNHDNNQQKTCEGGE